jgi:hypothetical protein
MVVFLVGSKRAKRRFSRCAVAGGLSTPVGRQMFQEREHCVRFIFGTGGSGDLFCRLRLRGRGICRR